MVKEEFLLILELTDELYVLKTDRILVCFLFQAITNNDFRPVGEVRFCQFETKTSSY